MGNTYVGVSDKARKVSNIYVGVSNIAKKVSKGYVGVNNTARLFYSAGSGVDPTKSSFTEAEVNALAAYGEINKVNIGSTFTLANSQDTSRTKHTYIVIGKDHKDLNVLNYGNDTPAAIGTVDVWATGAIASRVFNSTTPYGQWNNSDIRIWLNNSFYSSGFNTTTKVHFKRITTESYYTTGTYSTTIAKGNHNTTDYVKLLSSAEFNPSSYNTYMQEREGNGYEYFPSVDYITSERKRYASATGTAGVSYQWQRSIHCYSNHSNNKVWRVYSNGNLFSYLDGNTSFGIVPCFRLGA